MSEQETDEGKHDLWAKATATGDARINDNGEAELVQIEDLDVHTFNCSCGAYEMSREEASDHLRGDSDGE